MHVTELWRESEANRMYIRLFNIVLSIVRLNYHFGILEINLIMIWRELFRIYLLDISTWIYHFRIYLLWIYRFWIYLFWIYNVWIYLKWIHLCYIHFYYIHKKIYLFGYIQKKIYLLDISTKDISFLWIYPTKDI